MAAVPRSRIRPRNAASSPMIATTFSSTRFELFMRGQSNSSVPRDKGRSVPSPLARPSTGGTPRPAVIAGCGAHSVSHLGGLVPPTVHRGRQPQTP